MRFVHSLSTKPLGLQLYGSNILQRFIGNICYYSLSLAYLKKLNQKVILYTDTLGAALLSHLPYDEIHITLDDIPDELSPRFWAAGKIYAMEQEPLGSIHIDGDVFIKKESLIELINNSDWDLLVQNYEKDLWSSSYYEEFPHFKNEINFCKQFGVNPTQYGAYNTGILGFWNQTLKDKFINTYKSVSLNHSKLHYKELEESENRTPDLITEQTFIYQLSKPYKVKQLLDTTDNKIIREVCNNLGYQHVITMWKYTYLDKCLEVLKKVSPEIYNKTYKLCRNILKK